MSALPDDYQFLTGWNCSVLWVYQKITIFCQSQILGDKGVIECLNEIIVGKMSGIWLKHRPDWIVGTGPTELLVGVYKAVSDGTFGKRIWVLWLLAGWGY